MNRSLQQTSFNNYLSKYINDNKNNFFYPKDSFDLTTSNQMNQANFDRGVLAYNAADEYIGTKVDYLYLSVNTE